MHKIKQNSLKSKHGYKLLKNSRLDTVVPIISALEKLRQEDCHKFEVKPGHII